MHALPHTYIARRHRRTGRLLVTGNHADGRGRELVVFLGINTLTSSSPENQRESDRLMAWHVGLQAVAILVLIAGRRHLVFLNFVITLFLQCVPRACCAAVHTAHATRPLPVPGVRAASCPDVFRRD